MLGNDPLSNPLVARDSARLARYRQYLDFYEGRQWDKAAAPTERRITSNYARVLVKKAVSYLFPEPPTFSAIPDRESGRGSKRAAAAEALLAEVYADSNLASVDFTTALDAAVLGDGAFKVGWDSRKRLPVVTPVDVQSLSVWWRADDLGVVTRVCQRRAMTWDDARALYGEAASLPQVGPARPMPRPQAPDADVPGENMAAIMRRVRDEGAAWRASALTGPGAGRIPGGGAVSVTEEWTADRWSASAAGVTLAEGPNPYGTIPYIIFPNEAMANEFWGVSDLVDLMEPARELNRRMSVVSKVLELSGHPIAVLENVENAAGIQVGPGQLWELPEGAKAYLLDLLQGGGVTLHLEFIDKLYRVMHDLAEVPRTAFGDTGRAVSGVALEVEIQPLVQKVKRKRRVWDSVFARRNALILDLAARFGGANIGGIRRTRTLWAGILPSDRAALVDQEVKLIDAGLTSRRTSIARLGEEDPEAELALIDAERRREDQQQQDPPSGEGAGADGVG